MWHMLFISFVLNGIGDTFIDASTSYATILVAACYVSIFTVSYFSFFFIETPARRWIDKIKFSKSASTPCKSERNNVDRRKNLVSVKSRSKKNGFMSKGLAWSSV